MRIKVLLLIVDASYTQFSVSFNGILSNVLLNTADVMEFIERVEPVKISWLTGNNQAEISRERLMEIIGDA